MKTQLATICTLTLSLLSVAGMAAPQQPKVSNNHNKPTSPAAYTVILRAVRIQVAEDGTKKQQVITNSELRGAPGVRAHHQTENLLYTAVPSINSKGVVDLHLNVREVEGFARKCPVFLYQDALRATGRMRFDKPVQFAAVAETEDPSVLEALRKRAPLPATGKSYSVILFRAAVSRP